MTVQVQLPAQPVQYVDANGRLTVDGMLLIQRLVEAIEALDERVTALEP